MSQSSGYITECMHSFVLRSRFFCSPLACVSHPSECVSASNPPQRYPALRNLAPFGGDIASLPRIDKLPQTSALASSPNHSSSSFLPLHQPAVAHSILTLEPEERIGNRKYIILNRYRPNLRPPKWRTTRTPASNTVTTCSW